MSANGMDAGGVERSRARGPGAAEDHGPADTAMTVEPLDIGEAEAAPLQLSRISARTPAGIPAPEPLLDVGAPSAVREAYRELRYSLESARLRSGVRTIGIVSLDAGDGRSVVAANLAMALTEGGRRRVALVDADFERPSVARMLDAEAPAGLAEVLAGRIPLEAAMFASARNGLFAISAGNVTNTGLEPLDAIDAFGAIVDRLATVFDYVVVDTPPLARRVDAAALATKLDGVMFVVRARKTRVEALELGIARLGEGKVLGLVLNDAGKG